MSDPFRCIRCEATIDPSFKACPYCGEPVTDFIRRHATDPVDGKYQILKRLGVGGMGEVYKVHHVHLHTVRVLKLMRPNLSADTDAHERFLREARLATRIHHPNVATLHDFAKLPDGSFYMIWEHIEGKTISDVIRHGGAIAPRRAARLAIQALHGLDAIHKAGIIHRDVSPDNIMITHDSDGEERVKIIDLGIAKQGGEAAEQTSTGMFIGKLKYCSPEHLGLLPEGERMDGRADLYSFGIVLYEMVTGVAPFAEESAQQYLISHAKKTPRPLRVINPKFEANSALEAVIFRALEKEREKRFATAREFAAELERLLPTLEDSAAASQRTMMVQTADTLVADNVRAASTAPTIVNTPVPSSARDTIVSTPAPLAATVRRADLPPAEPTHRDAMPPRKSGKPLILVAIAAAIIIVLGGAGVTIWFVAKQARQLAGSMASDQTTTATSTAPIAPGTVTEASAIPGQTVSVEATPLTTATETAVATETTATAATAIETPPVVEPMRPAKQPKAPVEIAETPKIEEEPEPEPERTPARQTFAPGRGARLTASKEYGGSFARGFLPDYDALTKGEGVQWSWVAPGVRLSQHKIRIGNYRNPTGVTSDALMNWLTTSMQEEVDGVTEPTQGTLNADGMIYWAERSTTTKRGVGIEMIFRNASGEIVAMLRHRIYENTPEDAAEEMAEAVADFVDENK